MGTRERRRLDMLLLAAAAVLVGVAALVGALVGDDERITGMWAGARVAGDGAAEVVEVIDYEFGSEQRHGIFRDIPGLDPGDPVQVSSASAPAQVEVTGTAVQTRLRIGDPARTVSGRHRYTIGYRLPDVAPGGRLAWDAVGTAWPVAVGVAEVHVVAPYRLDGARCVRGETGSEEPCQVTQPEPGHLAARVEGLDPAQGVTLYAAAGPRLAAAPALPAPPSGVPADPGTGPVLPALLAAAAALAGAAAASRLVRRAGRERVTPGGATQAAFPEGPGEPRRGDPVNRERPVPWPDGSGREVRVDAAELASMATIEFVPPRELTPAQGGVVLTEAVREEHKVAWLIGAAVDGYLDLDGGRATVTLVRLPRRDGAATYLLDTAFAGRDRLTLGSYDPSFARAWEAVGNELAAWQRNCGLWDPAGQSRQTLVRVVGAVVAVVGLAWTALGGALANRSGTSWLALEAAGALLAGAGAAAAVRAWELRVRTPVGSGLWLRTESFRRFLAGSEAHHAEEAAKRGHLREYTAWAVAVGELDRWSRAVAASSVATDRAAAGYAMMGPSLLSATSASSTAPSSSGSGGGSGGGGGGGGTGGGAGGGGGGSW